MHKTQETIDNLISEHGVIHTIVALELALDDRAIDISLGVDMDGTHACYVKASKAIHKALETIQRTTLV